MKPDQHALDELLTLIESNDGSPKQRMMIASRALWMATLARQSQLSDEAFKASVSTYLDDMLRFGATLELEIDGMKAPNPYKARFAALAPVLERLSHQLDAVMLDPDASLSDMRSAVESIQKDPGFLEAEELLRARDLSKH